MTPLRAGGGGRHRSREPEAQRVQDYVGMCIAYFLFIVVAEHPIQETLIKETFILSHSLVPHGGHIVSAVKKPGGDCP